MMVRTYPGCSRRIRARMVTPISSLIFFRRAFDLLRDGGTFQAGDKFKPGPKWHILQFPAGCLGLLQSFSQLG